MLKSIFFTVGLFFAFTPATAQSVIDGVWAIKGASCSFGNTDIVPIRISNNQIRFYESLCDLTNPVTIRGMNGQLVDLACTGEGETWGYRGLFLLNTDGTLTFSRNGRTDTFERCE